MTDPRSDLITQIRTVLATVPGLWRVFYDGFPQQPAPGTPYIVESFVHGNETDVAIRTGSPPKRWRGVLESYQLELFLPVSQDVRLFTEQAGAIARKFLGANITLTDGSQVWFTDYALRYRPNLDTGWQKRVVMLTYKAVYTT